MALFNECMQLCAHIVLDSADIVRDGDFSTATRLFGRNVAGPGDVEKTFV